MTIVLVDDGVDTSHADLRDRIAVNGGERPDNGVDDDRNGLIDDVKGYDFMEGDSLAIPSSASGDPSHGTMMGLVALDAARLGTLGDQRLAELIKIVPLRVADDRIVDVAAVIAAIRYAGNRGGRSIVNLSLGSFRRTLPRSLLDAIAREQNVIFVVSAGNQGKRVDGAGSSLCQSEAENVVCVAAIDAHDKLSVSPRASNFGPLVDVAAIGVDVGVTGSSGSTRTETGTSLAAAHVSGVAARVWSAAPGLNATEIARVLCTGARRSAALGDDLVRCGIVDPIRSLRAATSGPGRTKISSLSSGAP